jgi:hypothetical protein
VYPLQQQHIAALEARDAGGSSTSSTATSTTSSRTTSSVPPPTGTALRDLAARKGIYIGTALDGPYLSNSTYANIAGSQFSMVTPGNEMKWTSVSIHSFKHHLHLSHPRISDREYARSFHIQRWRCHCCFCGGEQPKSQRSQSRVE